MVSPISEEWTEVDVLLDWNKQLVSIYIDGEGLAMQPFFTQQSTKIEEANALALYGLSAGSVSRFRNVQVCKERCTGGKFDYQFLFERLVWVHGQELDEKS